MNHGKVDVKDSDKLRIGTNNFKDIITGKCFLSQTFLEFHQNFNLLRIRSVKDRRKGRVFTAETIEEMLTENQGGIPVNRFLNTELTSLEKWLKGRLRNTVNQGCFLQNLRNGMLNWRALLLGIGKGRQVKGHDCDTIGKVFNVLSSRKEFIIMIQIAHGREEGINWLLTITNDNTFLTRPFSIEGFNDRSTTLHYTAHDLFVNFQSVGSCLREESVIGNFSNIDHFSFTGIWDDKFTSGNEIAA